MRVNIFPDLESMSRAAAEFFIDIADKAVKAKRKFSVALSGGNTPRAMFEYLADIERQKRTPWEKIDIFWGDERCVPQSDPSNNAFNAFSLLLNKIPAASGNIHKIESDLPPDEAAKRYEDVLRNYFGNESPRFDLIFLGLGENGHTASLFPHTPVLKEIERWVSSVFLEERNMSRITLTPAVINQAENIVFLVAGTNKAWILRQVIEGEYEPYRFPAQLIRPVNGILYWFVDNEASRLLSKKLIDSN